MAEWLISLQIQISIAVVVILLLRKVMKKMPKVYSYLLWLLVFTRLLVPVSFETRFSFMPSEQEREAWTGQVMGYVGIAAGEIMENPGEHFGASDVEIMGGSTLDAGNESGDSVVADNPGIGNVQTGAGDVNTGIVFENTIGEGANNFPGEGNSTGNVVSSENDDVAKDSLSNMIFLIIWLVGVAVVLGFNVWAMARMYRLLGKPEECRRVKVVNPFTGKERSVPVYLCENSSTPFTLGLFRPAIYLPGELTGEELEYILCHERVHISRKDNLVKHVTFLLTAIYWFNPFVWVAFFQMERDMEMSCDEKVLKLMGGTIKKDYCRSLLSFAEGRGKMPATHLTFGENSVKQRVKNVLSYKNAKKWSVAIGAVVLIVVVVALFTTGRGDVETDGPGSMVQGEENQDAQSGTGQELASGSESLVPDQDSQGTYDEKNQENQGQTQDEQSADFTTPVLTKEDFENRYGQLGSYDFSVMGYGDSYYRSIIQQLFYGSDEATKEYCMKFTDPVTAAVELLNLGEGTGAVAGDLSVTEGTKNVVVYTFAQNNSVVEIPMVLIEGVFGIWAPEGTPVRQAERTEYAWMRSKEGDTVENIGWVEVTRYGIYCQTENGQLTCLYPGYVNTKHDIHVSDGILFFVVDSDYQEGDVEYQENAIAMLDLNTLQLDKDAIPLNINRTTALIRSIYSWNGVLSLECNGQYYHLPLVNTGDMMFSTSYTFNGKAVAELTEREQDAYGVSIREQLLQNPGLILELSNRTAEETYILIDMDGDGETEKIVLYPDPDATGNMYGSALDRYVLKIGDSIVTGRGDYVHNQILAFSLDGKEIALALQEEGPSGDPQTHVYIYRNGEVKAAGSFDNYITYAKIEGGNIHTTGGAYAIQTDSRRCQYTINSQGELVLIEQDVYELVALNEIKLLVDLPIHSAPGSEDVTYMKPQTVRFTLIDKTFKWVYVEGEDGTGGWMLVGTFGWINELKKSSMEVFEGLSMAG